MSESTPMSDSTHDQTEPDSSLPTAGAASVGAHSRESRLVRLFGPTGATVVEWAAVIAGAVLLALVVKTFMLQAFFIPSPSMYPTLKEGDRVLVNKLSYRLGDVSRGDVVVFERPASEAPSAIPELIKRVVGLSGDTVTFRGGQVYINGTVLEESYLPGGVMTSADFAPNRCTEAAPCLVPPGHVWVMGDNRNDSKDSRYFGAIPESSIVGRAFVIVWPLSRMSWL
jgi:signal peptidase I